MRKITLKDLKKALKNSWSRETSSDPNNWTSENPAWGQCAVTALIIQDYFGGDLLRAAIEGIGSHYWNQLPDGSEIDLTKIQFLTAITIPAGEIRLREYVLSYPATVKRYEILKQRVEKYLKEEKK